MMQCEKCGWRMKVVEKRYLRREEVYRRHVCSRCGFETFTVEYEIDQTDGFLEAWETATQTPPRRTDKEI